MRDSQILSVAILDVHLPSGVIRAALSLHISHGHVPVSALVFRPVPGALALPQLGQHDDDADALLGNHPPEVGYGRLRGVLRYYEGLQVVVALDERGVYVCRVLFAGQGREDHAVSVVRNHHVAAVFLAVLLAAGYRTGFSVFKGVSDILEMVEVLVSINVRWG